LVELEDPSAAIESYGGHEYALKNMAMVRRTL
jgi:hypothetical protein